MRPHRALLIGACVAALAGGGVVVAQSEQEPAPATPSSDPIGDILRETAPIVTPPPLPAPVVVAPPTVPNPPSALDQDLAEAAAADEQDAEEEAEDEEEEAETETAEAEEEPAVPAGRRTRRPIAIVQAIDKITAESMRFEVRVGGPPVRFGTSLIFVARACEVTASDEPLRDAAAYLEIRSQPRGAVRQTEARQVFRGWMYASAPAVTRLEHPIYDAWVVGCRAA